MDALLRQLSEEEYLSVDTFANNWVHLTTLYAKILEQMNDRILMAVGRMIMVIKNFLRCPAALECAQSSGNKWPPHLLLSSEEYRPDVHFLKRLTAKYLPSV